MIIGTWSGAAANYYDNLIPFSEPITLNDDATGTFKLSDTYDFLWWFEKKTDDSTYVYDVFGEFGFAYLIYDKESGTLALGFTENLIIFYENKH